MHKKAPALQPVTEPRFQVRPPEPVAGEVGRSEALERRRGLPSEGDDMWSAGRGTAPPRWWWHAMAPPTGKVLAEGFGRRTDDVFLKLQQLWAPCGITKFSPDGWGASERHLAAEQQQGGQEHPQKMESKQSNLRTRITRLVRRTLCFSKTERRHALGIGLFINR
jgi:insertion element IS1 protein InsB